MTELGSSSIALIISIAGMALAGALSVLNSHAIYLYGHRLRGRPGAASFRLAIQNAENVALKGRLRAEVTCNPGAVFRRVPRVFAGPRAMQGSLSPDHRTYVLDFESIPAYDTWVIVCEVTEQKPIEESEAQNLTAVEGHAHGILFRLVEVDPNGKPRDRGLRRLSVNQLSLGANDQLRVAGRARQPLLPLGALTVLVACSCYWLTVAFFVWLATGARPVPVWHVEGPVTLLLITGSAFFFWSAAPPEPRCIQGYLDPTYVTPGSRSSAPSAQSAES